MIDLDESLSWEHVSELVQNSGKSSKKWMDYFQEDEKTFLKKTIPSMSNNDEITQQYISMLRQIEWCIENDIMPESDEGFQIATKLIEISNESFHGDVELMDKFWEVKKQPAKETGYILFQKMYWSLPNVVLLMQQLMNRNMHDCAYYCTVLVWDAS